MRPDDDEDQPVGLGDSPGLGPLYIYFYKDNICKQELLDYLTHWERQIAQLETEGRQLIDEIEMLCDALRIEGLFLRRQLARDTPKFVWRVGKQWISAIDAPEITALLRHTGKSRTDFLILDDNRRFLNVKLSLIWQTYHYYVACFSGSGFVPLDAKKPTERLDNPGGLA